MSKPDGLVPCPRCSGSGRSDWRQPGGGVEKVRCGLCAGNRKVDAKTAKREATR